MIHEDDQPLFCPIPPHPEFVPADPALMDALLAYLETEPEPDTTTEFSSGTLIPGGKLDMCKQSIGAAGASRLFKALEANGYVEDILLGTNGLGDPGAEALAAHIQENPNLKTIYLGCNRIGPTGARQLAESLKSSTSIRSLWLKRNKLGRLGAAAVAELVQENPRIRTLDMVHTLIGSAGLTSIAQAITHPNCGVETLMLGGNYFRQEEGPHFRAMLEGASQLKSLFVDVNHLGSIGATEIAQGWAHRPDLLALGLASNAIGNPGVAALAHHLPADSQMKILDLGYRRSTRTLGAIGNRIGDEAVPDLIKILESLPHLQIFDLGGNELTEKAAWRLVEVLEQHQSIVKMSLNKGLSFHLRRKVRSILERNQVATKTTYPEVCPDFKVIRSVYR